jgi:putative inorganic carbon (hco3(-)) transporter
VLASGACALSAGSIALAYHTEPWVPLFLLAALAVLFVSFAQPLAALYAAIVAIPLGTISVPVADSFRVTPTEGLLALSAAAWLIRSVALRERVAIPSPLGRPLALLVLAIVPGLLVSHEPGLVAKQLTVWAVAFAVYQLVIAMGSVRTARTIVLLLGFTVAIAAAGVVVTGGQAQQVTTAGEVVGGRAIGMFTHPNELGSFSAVAIPILLVISLQGRAALRLPALVGVGVSLAALALSLSRGAAIGLMAALVVLLLWPVFRRAATVAALAVGTLLLVTGFGAAEMLPGEVELAQRFESAGAASQSVELRDKLYRTTPGIIHDHPLFGVGANSFGTVSSSYGLIDPYTRLALTQAHNLPLTIAAELGLLGLAAFLWFVVRLARVLVRACSPAAGAARHWGFAVAAVFVALGAQGMVDYPLGTSAQVGLLFTLAGCAVVLARHSSAQAPASNLRP